jgi:flagellar basal body-associated protein FliL
LVEISNKTIMIGVAVVVVVVSLFGYQMWHVSPSWVMETVKIVANTESGCIAETMDGFPVNIGPCDANEGDIISAKVDTKLKERAAAVNP